MNGIDYTKQLAKDREYMNDTIQKTKQSTEKRIAQNNDRNEYVQTKQRENFVEDRADLENHYKESLSKAKDQSAKHVEDKSEKFQKLTKAQQAAFEKERESNRKDFDQRLTDIKSNYNKAVKSERTTNDDLRNMSKQRYDKNVSDLKAQGEKHLKEYQGRMTDAGGDIKDSNRREKEQLVRANEDQLNNLRKEEGHKQADLKERIHNNLRKVNEVHTAEKEQMKDYTDTKLERLHKTHDERMKSLSEDYARRNEDLSTNQQRETISTNRQHQDKFVEAERDFNKKIRDMELARRRQDNGSGKFAKVMQEQQGLKDKEVLENKIGRLSKQITETQKNYNLKASQDHHEFNETLKSQNAEAIGRHDRKVNELVADKVVTVAGERVKAEKKYDNLEHLSRVERETYEQQLMQERHQSGVRLTNLKENFNNSMKTLEERLKISLDDVTNVANKDKEQFVKNLNERRTKEIFELKRDFAKVMDQTSLGYEQKISELERKNQNLQLLMDQKIENIVDQTEKTLESERKLAADRRASEFHDHQITMDQREYKIRSDMNTVIVNYQKKLDKMQNESDTKLKLLTNNYENKLKELQANKAKEIAQKDTTSILEMQRLKSAFEDEKKRLISSYENQIAGMKAGHEERMLQLDEFKKLS